MTACRNLSVFDCCLQEKAVIGLREVTPGEQQPVSVEPPTDGGLQRWVEDKQNESNLPRDVPDRMVCSTCRCPFNSREEQMEHYKLDWHRFNLRQRITGLPQVTVEEFERKTGTGDLSSISGSDSDSEEQDSDGDWAGKCSDVPCKESSTEADAYPHRISSKVVFQNAEGQYLGVHRCVLQAKLDGEADVMASLKNISDKTVWVILMTGGGHFAGAIFKGKEVIQHKTFHRYTVRAKRGTAQGLRDAQNRSHAPKSAGAALRRYNEAALVKDVQDLLDIWVEHLKEASLIFLRAPSYNKTLFFGGRGAPLDRKDARVRTLPFATRRATFREVQRVHELLSTVLVYDKETELSTIFSPSKKVWKKVSKPPAQSNPSEEKDAAQSDSSDAEDGGEIQLETVEVTLGTLDLREYEIQPSGQRKRRRKRKEGSKMDKDEVNTTEVAEQQVVEEEEVSPAELTKDTTEEKQRKNKAKRKAQNKKQQPEEEDKEEKDADESWEFGLRDALFTACKVGNVDSLCGLLHLSKETAEGSEQPGNIAPLQEWPPGCTSPLTLVNKAIDSSGFTLLHVASAAGQKSVVKLLMDAGADPACRDKKGRTPYNVAPEKDTRNVFRKYMGENPDKYDYSKAQVPGPLTAEIESKKSEKKKAQKASKKMREKEQKEEKQKQELEAEEKKRFASLTDREKRALAAERRLAVQVAATGVGLSNTMRCWQCGESVLGKIPFQYLDYSFCSPRCVQAHRKSSTATAKN